MSFTKRYSFEDAIQTSLLASCFDVTRGLLGNKNFYKKLIVARFFLSISFLELNQPLKNCFGNLGYSKRIKGLLF